MYVKHIKHHIIKWIPIVNSIRNYSKTSAAADLLAGVTVGLMLIPQSIAYAALAGLSPQYGLYSAIAGGLAYAVFGTVKQVTIGPTAILALITFQYAHENPPIAALLSFISGFVCILFGFLNLGFVINFVSTPVISGYTSAAAIVIASSQLKGILGLTFSAKTFLSTIYQLAINIDSTKINDAFLGIICIVGLILIKEIPKVKAFSQLKFLFYASLARNLIVVLVSGAMSYTLCYLNDSTPFTLIGNITDGFPTISLPDFSPYYDGIEYSFTEILQIMGFGITTIILLTIISEVVVAKVFIKGDRMDASQELIAVGFSNLLGSFIGSMPVTGSFSRSAVNSSCGVKTPLAGIYAALLVILATLFLTPYFYYIPRAALSAIIMTAVIYMVEVDVIASMWRNNRKDLIPTIGTFLSSLCFGIEFGLVCGLIIDMAFLLYYNSYPNISIEKFDKCLVVTPRSGLLYPSANFLQEKIIAETSGTLIKDNETIVLNLQQIYHIDYTTLQVLKNLIKDLKANNKQFVIVNVNEDVKSKLIELSSTITDSNFSDLTKIETKCKEIYRKKLEQV